MSAAPPAGRSWKDSGVTRLHTPKARRIASEVRFRPSEGGIRRSRMLAEQDRCHQNQNHQNRNLWAEMWLNLKDSRSFSQR